MLKKEDYGVMTTDETASNTHYVHTLMACSLLVLTILACIASPLLAAGQPKTVAEIALYQGPDREKLFIEGAKREGKLTLYISNRMIAEQVSRAFGKKYPFINVLVWHGDSKMLIKRVVEEYAAGRNEADALDSTYDSIRMLREKGVFQEYYTPEAAHYPDDVKGKGKAGLYYLGERESYNSLGFNTKLISPAEAPKNLNDLLDPRWKGKMSIAGASMGVRWMASVLQAMGMGYLEKLSRQGVRVLNLTAGGVGVLVIAGEVPLSPNITDFTVSDAKPKGAPIEWRPLEPVLANTGYLGVTTMARHPYAAMLFVDYIYSKEGQNLVVQGGQSSPRKDMGGMEKKFKKSYVGSNYSAQEYEVKFNEWEGLMKRFFIQKR